MQKLDHRKHYLKKKKTCNLPMITFDMIKGQTITEIVRMTTAVGMRR